MSRRPPSTPPTIAGFSAIRLLGSGGFADVFLYEEQLLKRKVAVKVLLAGDLAAGTLENFTNEANLMAQLSNHPSIVSVYQAGISEDGRPFIVMEYCSRPNLQARYRAAKFSEAEALKVGVQIAGAVETAHRGGILHRDIKPANVLVTDYGRPALTDFGIAAATGTDVQGGLSVPWAPPESFGSGARGDARSDVYSLGATIYTLLAGRTPFELPGGSNSSVDVMGRIQTGTLPPIGRPDVSAAFEKVLATSMAKDPARRYQTAMEFARALQRVQIELGITPTSVDVIEDVSDVDEHDEDDGLTRIRGVMTIEAQGPERTTTRPGVTVPGETAPAPAMLMQPPRTFTPPALPIPEPPVLEDTMLREPPAAVTPVEADAGQSQPADRRRLPVRAILIGVVATIAATALVTTLVLVFGNQRPAPAVAEPSKSVQPVDPVNPMSQPVPNVPAFSGKVRGGKAAFAWTNPAPQSGDAYLWRTVKSGARGGYTRVDQPSIAVPADPSGVTCIEVVVLRGTTLSSEPTMGCAK
jgi:serine/threonine protein kinase